MWFVQCKFDRVLSLLPTKWGYFWADEFFDTTSAKTFSEMIPHNTQCLLMLGIAIERYVLVCHAAKAKQFYKGYPRFGFFSLVTLLIFLANILPMGDLIYHMIQYRNEIRYPSMVAQKNPLKNDNSCKVKLCVELRKASSGKFFFTTPKFKNKLINWPLFINSMANEEILYKIPFE